MKNLKLNKLKHFSNTWLCALCTLVLWIPSMSLAEVDIREIFSRFQPYITLEGEFNDNINLTARNRIDDFITTLSPGLRFSTFPRSPVTGEFRRTPTAEGKFGMDLDFRAGLVFYAKEEDNNYTSLNGTLNAWYAFTKNLTIRVRDYLIRSDEVREADYSATALPGQNLLSRTNRRVTYYRNVFEPSLEYRFGRENLFTLNYRNNIYEIKSRVYGDSIEDSVNPRLVYWFDIRNGVSLEYELIFGDFLRSPDLVGHRGRGRYTYRFNPRTSIFGEYIQLWRNFESPSIDYVVYRPSVGLEHAFTSTLTGVAQLGYFWQDPHRGSTTKGFSYDMSLTQRAERTTYVASFQGGYTEDYFTAENLGFNRYHRVMGRITHRLLQRMTVGLFSSYERAKYSGLRIGGRKQVDRIWATGGNASYQILRWLTLSLDASHRENHSNIEDRDYSEYRGIFRITASY